MIGGPIPSPSCKKGGIGQHIWALSGNAIYTRRWPRLPRYIAQHRAVRISNPIVVNWCLADRLSTLARHYFKSKEINGFAIPFFYSSVKKGGPRHRTNSSFSIYFFTRLVLLVFVVFKERWTRRADKYLFHEFEFYRLLPFWRTKCGNELLTCKCLVEMR